MTQVFRAKTVRWEASKLLKFFSNLQCVTVLGHVAQGSRAVANQHGPGVSSECGTEEEQPHGCAEFA